MMDMIMTQKESGGTEIRLDGRKIAESVGQNFYDMGNGVQRIIMATQRVVLDGAGNNILSLFENIS